MNELIQPVKLVAFDVDGVMTDGKIIFDSEGRQIRSFDVQDGSGIFFLHRLGFTTALISGKDCSAVRYRAQELSIPHVFLGVRDKRKILDQLLAEISLSPKEVCFVGDDLVDLPVLYVVGLPVAVANARPEVKDAAKYITSRPGGNGAVREVAELILKGQDKWKTILQFFGTSL